jgi:CubicO group peptidase (beta-lactamase class C family)
VAPGPNLPAHAPDELMKRFGNLPLVHQPGERWMYHSGSDILGVLIARVTGRSLEAFLRERIFDPLGMKDTAFSAPAAKVDRLATSYRTDGATGGLALFDEARGGRFTRPPTFEAGGGGLVSTVDDYLAFGRMMLSNGKAGSERILSRLSVELMTTDHITPAQKAASDFFPGSGTIAVGASACPSSPGATMWRRSPAVTAGTAATGRPGIRTPKRT